MNAIENVFFLFIFVFSFYFFFSLLFGRRINNLLQRRFEKKNIFASPEEAIKKKALIGDFIIPDYETLLTLQDGEEIGFGPLWTRLGFNKRVGKRLLRIIKE